jgi:ribosomal protein S6--L-glutamate ligase
MRLAVLHDQLNPVVTEALGRLSGGGVSVELVGEDAVARAELTSLRPAHDLYYLKTASESALGYAGALHHKGAATVNPYPRVAECTNKAAVAAALHAAGLPVPETWVACRAESFAAQLDGGPLVIKPCRGSRGRGVRVAYGPEDLAAYGDSDELLMAQRHHPSDGDGRDFKLYCMGARVFGVRRAFRAYDGWGDKERASEPFAPDSALRDLALRCGRALGLRLYGVDVVMSSGAGFVVDVNKCPGFLGVPGAAALLCEWLAAAVREAAS